MQMTMGIVRMSQYEMYWCPEFRYDKIRSAMTLKRYKLIRTFIHANDNTKKTNPENVKDKLFKLRRLLDVVRNNCMKVGPEQCHSIDELIIPAKTKRSGGVKQYNTKRTCNWGFINMVRVGQSGMIYDLFMYRGKHSAGAEQCGAVESVLHLAKELPKHKNFRVYFDNWFSTLPLLIKLHSSGILATATFRSIGMGLCPLMSDKDSKSEGRGSFDYRVYLNSSLRMVKWYDNKAVVLGSTYSSVQSTTTKQRWDTKKKENCNVIYLDMVKEYNKGMGDVDLNGMLISLYRFDIQTRKPRYLKIITHCLDICNVNAWLLYKRFSDQLDVPKKEQRSLLDFTKEVADALLSAG